MDRPSMIRVCPCHLLGATSLRWMPLFLLPLTVTEYPTTRNFPASWPRLSLQNSGWSLHRHRPHIELAIPGMPSEVDEVLFLDPISETIRSSAPPRQQLPMNPSATA